MEKGGEIFIYRIIPWFYVSALRFVVYLETHHA